jgi:hypothetical protein
MNEGALQVFGYGLSGNVVSKKYSEIEGGWITGTINLGII